MSRRFLSAMGLVVAIANPQSLADTPTPGAGGAATVEPRIAFRSDRGNSPGRFDIWLMDLEGGQLENLTNTPGISEGVPKISPTGRYLLYWSDEAPNLRRLDLVSRLSRPVLANVANLRPNHDWSPDEQRIVVSIANLNSFQARSQDLWTYALDADGNGILPVRLTNANGTSHDQTGAPAWSPDGQTILFTGSRIGTPHRIWAVSATSPGPATMGLDSGTGNDQLPAWLPDGSRFLWENDRLFDFYHATASGTLLGRLTIGARVAGATLISNTELVAHSDRSGSTDLWRMNLDGSQARNLTDHPANDGSPDFGLVPVTNRRRPVIVVPGIMGSALRDGDEDVWLVDGDTCAVGLLNLQRLLAAKLTSRLDLSEAGESLGDVRADGMLTSVVVDWKASICGFGAGVLAGLGHPWAGFLLGFTCDRLLCDEPVYDLSGVIDELEALGYRRGQDLFLFGYDWRLSLDEAASSLDAFVAAHAGWGEVDIVAHSMGGLVARTYSAFESARVHRIIYLGTPQLGGPEAYRTLVHGAELGDGKLRLSLERIQNYPSLYALLPTPEYTGGFEQQPLVTVVDGSQGGGSTASRLGVSLPALYGTEAITSGWEPLVVPNPGLAPHFVDGRSTVPLGSAAEHHLIVATDTSTTARFEVILTGPALERRPHFRPVFAPGDGTVPLLSAVGGPSFTSATYVSGVTHTMYGQSAEARSAIAAILGGGVPEAGAPALPRESVVVITLSPVTLVATDAAGSVNLVDGDGQPITTIAGSRFFRFPDNEAMLLPIGASYTVAAAGLADGDFGMIVQRIDGSGGILEQRVVVGVPCSAATVATFSVAPSGAPSELAVDTDGDGFADDRFGFADLADTSALPPIIRRPRAVAATAQRADGAFVVFDVVGLDAFDRAPVDVACEPPSGSWFPPGVTTVLCTAIDARGSRSVASFPVDVTFAWSGLLPPVHADGSNVFEPGRTVPLKFRLAGQSAGIAEVRAGVYLRRLGDHPGQALPAPSTSAANDGHLFRYDPGDDQYIFNLATRGLEVGAWELLIELGDGASHATRFVVLR